MLFNWKATQANACVMSAKNVIAWLCSLSYMSATKLKVFNFRFDKKLVFTNSHFPNSRLYNSDIDKLNNTSPSFVLKNKGRVVQSNFVQEVQNQIKRKG